MILRATEPLPKNKFGNTVVFQHFLHSDHGPFKIKLQEAQEPHDTPEP